MPLKPIQHIYSPLKIGNSPFSHILCFHFNSLERIILIFNYKVSVNKREAIPPIRKASPMSIKVMSNAFFKPNSRMQAAIVAIHGM